MSSLNCFQNTFGAFGISSYYKGKTEDNMDLNWKLTDKDIFHVHSFRCGHAEDVSDEAYIKKAIELGAESIWFSDHAPFPGDYFRGRMRLDQLDEYISTLSDLKEKNKDKIAVHIGLEIEYLPSFDKAGYYAELKDKEGLEFFLLGQHFAEDPDDPGKYTFEWEKDRVEEHEFEVMGKAIVEGVKTGYFDAVAHPDRIYRRCAEWNDKMDKIAGDILGEAKERKLAIELNMHSVKSKNLYWPEFWEQATGYDPMLVVIKGLDAHSIKDFVKRFERMKKY